MHAWKQAVLQPTATILEAMEVINNTGLRAALVVDHNERFLGIITDGDIRRGILRDISIHSSVTKILTTSPITAKPKISKQAALALMQANDILHLPILNDQGMLIDLKILDELLKSKYVDNWVILMAGGLGMRLMPLTANCPKPLLKIGDKPILENILDNFISAGFKNFYISLNYKGKMIEDYFQDGSQLGINIQYLWENQPLGTAGALSLLPEKPASPVIVMNSDLLTKANFQKLYDTHCSEMPDATLAVREYDFQIPYGVVKLEGDSVIAIDEKPTQQFFVNAGIYVLNPEVIELIPKNTYYDMPSLC
jgi:UTP-glucose-1-phosphate uridylyltransferase